MFNRLLSWFRNDWLGEYHRRFIAPLRERAEALGIPETVLDDMWAIARKNGSPDIPPGRIMRNLIDNWELKHVTFKERPPETEEEIDAYLRALGYDPDELVAHFRANIKPFLDKWREEYNQTGD